MLDSIVNSVTERLWPAGVAAVIMHSLAISAFAFSMAHSHGGNLHTFKDNFHVEVVFQDQEQKAPLSEATVAQPSTHESSQIDKVVFVTYEAPLKKHPKRPLVQSSKRLTSQGVGLASKESSGAPCSQPLFNPPPVYPCEARRQKKEGVVLVRVSLSQEGTVAEAIALAPYQYPLLEKAALDAIRHWRFQPGARVVEVPIEFKLVS